MGTSARGEAGVTTDHAVGHWIDGRAVNPGANTLPVHDPATSRVLRVVELGDGKVVDDAVHAASRSAQAWGATPVTTRTRLLRQWRDLIVEKRDELVAIMGQEQGKVRADAEGEVLRGVETIDFACAAAHQLKGEISDDLTTGVDAFSLRAPVGVCAIVTPFNFPFMAPAYLSSMAMASGNAVVLKPSERVPSASLVLAELAARAGIPDGVLNVVQGDREVVDALLEHEDIAAMSFIGSTPVARHVYTRAAASGKRVQAFGGAKNHMVVMPDADLDFAADAACSAAYGSSGQRCMAVSVVVAVGDVGDSLVAAITERASAIRVGPATDADAEMGPLVSKQARDRVTGAIAGATTDHARIVLDGRNHERAGGDGYFVGPTLVDFVTPDMPVYQDEVFGPVLSVVRVDTLDEALDLIDQNPYGNGAAIFTASGHAARHFQSRASVGMVGINVPIPIPHAVYSFGGWKQSRFGDQHMAGTEGFRFFTKQKVVTSRWPNTRGEGVSLAFPSTSSHQEENRS
ncbi:CoA-acylating methylmalonate-semialdehyde dehydrogenase [Streptomyces chartreusis]|uniref:CoA-acylating methylmalonate-semialdehyde dehydrogenase n=1 Tax=Streptomyces chartreusis TaxID=1969 RepID=UPI003679524B